jgi:hypothetical protein
MSFDDGKMMYDEDERDQYDSEHFDEIYDHENTHDDLVILEAWYA